MRGALARKIGYKIIPGSTRPISRNIVVRSREQQKIEILVVVYEGLLELEYRCGVDADVQKAVDQQKLTLEIGRIGQIGLLLVVVVDRIAFVALAPRVPEQALVVIAAGGDPDLEEVGVTQQRACGHVSACRKANNSHPRPIVSRIDAGKLANRGDVVIEIARRFYLSVRGRVKGKAALRGSTPIDHHGHESQLCQRSGFEIRAVREARGH